jgi:antitoxin VapB
MVEYEVEYLPNMTLNIKNKDAHKLARQLARLTGESMTQAVTEAVRERLQRVQGNHTAGLSDRLLEIGRDCSTRLKEPFRSGDHGDLLYDEKGLPK